MSEFADYAEGIQGYLETFYGESAVYVSPAEAETAVTVRRIRQSSSESEQGGIADVHDAEFLVAAADAEPERLGTVRVGLRLGDVATVDWIVKDVQRNAAVWRLSCVYYEVHERGEGYRRPV